ncbi:MAG TPA: DNA-binding protein [Lachnospiraceae bacterium]|nr:DNA-binding protein [Lachnospiraceae bacterium]
MTEKIVERNLLYDFYGELLTEHQRKIYEDAVYGDLSLSELSEEYGITRQGVHDLLKRCDKILSGYEGKLHLLEKFRETKELTAQIHKLAVSRDAAAFDSIAAISEKIFEIL